jgi:hypothetical protein
MKRDFTGKENKIARFEINLLFFLPAFAFHSIIRAKLILTVEDIEPERNLLFYEVNNFPKD